MGGNALSFETSRISAVEYDELKQRVIHLLGLHVNRYSFKDVQAYSTKESFGDLDIVYSNMHVDMHDVDYIIKTLHYVFSPREIVKNGPVISFDVEGFQVDLIYVKPDSFHFAINYFSWNDLGNFIGRTAHRLGFKFGHDGLKYVLRDPEHDTRVVAELVATKSFPAALRVLGFSREQFYAGFSTPEEIYEYAASSEYFDPASFLLTNRNRVARVRDKKRKMYNGAVEYYKKKFSIDDSSPTTPIDKAAFLESMLLEFPDFDLAYRTALEKLEKEKAVKAVFNGKVIGDLFAVSGKDLGAKMKSIKEYLVTHNLMNWVGTLSQDTFSALVLHLDSENKFKKS